MAMPTPTKVTKPIVSKRTPQPENLTAKELEAFMNKYGFGPKEFADLMGCSVQAVNLWLSEERQFSVTNTRLIKLFTKYPKLMEDF